MMFALSFFPGQWISDKYACVFIHSVKKKKNDYFVVFKNSDFYHNKFGVICSSMCGCVSVQLVGKKYANKYFSNNTNPEVG